MEKMNNRYQSNEDLNTFRLTPMKRMYYALGDFGYNFMYYWLSTYLMIYYTDTIGIPAATVSVMMLVVRIFDAFNDPVHWRTAPTAGGAGTVPGSCWVP